KNRAHKATWNAGASWDRNEDAGLLNRYVVYGGWGNAWYDRDDLKWRTTYSLSYADREEEVDDPEKERRFPGSRVGSVLMTKWGANTTYDNDFTAYVNFQDLHDYNMDFE